MRAARRFDLLEILHNHIVHNRVVIPQVQTTQSHVQKFLLVELHNAVMVILNVWVFVHF